MSGRRGILILGGMAAAAAAGLLALGLLAGAGEAALRAWFAALLTLGAVPIGCLPLLIANHLLRRDVFLARVLEAGCLCLLPLSVFFLPVALFPSALYGWTDPGFVPAGPLQAAWLDPLGFGLRAALYFAVWIGSAALLIREDRVLEPGQRRTGIAVAAALAYAITASFASLDWYMTLDPAFSSAGFGWMMAAHHVAAALGFAVLADDILTGETEPPGVVRGLLVGGVLLWAFFAYMDWLVIWSGGVPELGVWYLERDGGPWPSLRWAVAGLMVLGVAAVLWLPLHPAAWLVRLSAGAILLGQLLEGLWHLLPAIGPWGWEMAALCGLAGLAVGGALSATFLWALARRPGELNPGERAAGDRGTAGPGAPTGPVERSRTSPAP